MLVIFIIVLLGSEGIPIRHALSDWGGIQKLIISTMARAHFRSQDMCATYSPSGKEVHLVKQGHFVPLTFWGRYIKESQGIKTLQNQHPQDQTGL